MRDIVKLQEAIASQRSVIKEYQEAIEENHRKLKNDIEMALEWSIDIAIASIENKLKESHNIQE